MEESELIDKFLRGELDEEEHGEFLRACESDAALKRRVALRKLIIDGIGAAYTEKLKGELAAFDQSLDKGKWLQFSWRMAAIFAVFILAGGVLYFQFSRVTPRDFDVPDSGIPNEMGVSANLAFTKAMNSFKAGDVTLAGQLLNEMLARNASNDTLLYYSGICDFRNNDVTAAINKWLRVDQDSEFNRKVSYRLGIAYWVSGENEKAKAILQGVSTDTLNPYQGQAARALRALN